MLKMVLLHCECKVCCLQVVAVQGSTLLYLVKELARSPPSLVKQLCSSKQQQQMVTQKKQATIYSTASHNCKHAVEPIAR
jgi:hypothetical protein